MKQWNGFKIGRLYIDIFDTYHDSDGKPLPLDEDGEPAPMLVVAIERLPHLGAHLYKEPLADVTFIHRGRTVTYSIPQTWTEESGDESSRWKPLPVARTRRGNEV